MTDREAFARFLTFPGEISGPWGPPGWRWEPCRWSNDRAQHDYWIMNNMYHEPDDIDLAALTGRLAVWMYERTALSIDDLTGDLLPALVAAFEEVEVGR
jgi:hypothetical protein